MQQNLIQQVFQQHFSREVERERLTPHARRAAKAIIDCRTGAYGAHVERCASGCTTRTRYHSCHHRSCPQCNAVPRARWLEQQQARLLSCEHYHIVFTVPSEFRAYWQMHPELVANDIFQAAREAILRLCRDPLYMGATPGILAAFHSWSRRLDVHPHLHCLVSAEGVTDDGQWRSAARECFLPGKLLMAVFRKLLMRRWFRRHQQGGWHPSLGNAEHIHLSLCRAAQKSWRVKVHPRYRHGRGVAVYLARYMRGGPCHARQLQWLGEREQVLFRPKQAEKVAAPRVFDSAGFIRHYLMHVPPHRQRMVRGYGVYAGRGQAVKARNATRPVVESPRTAVEQVFQAVESCCPHCGERVTAQWLRAPEARGSPSG